RCRSAAPRHAAARYRRAPRRRRTKRLRAARASRPRSGWVRSCVDLRAVARVLLDDEAREVHGLDGVAAGPLAHDLANLGERVREQALLVLAGVDRGVIDDVAEKQDEAVADRRRMLLHGLDH